MAKVKAHVYVLVGGVATLLRPSDDVPAGVTVTNPDVLADEPKAAAKDETPKSTPAKKAPAAKAEPSS